MYVNVKKLHYMNYKSNIVTQEWMWQNIYIMHIYALCKSQIEDNVAWCLYTCMCKIRFAI